MPYCQCHGEIVQLLGKWMQYKSSYSLLRIPPEGDSSIPSSDNLSNISFSNSFPTFDMSEIPLQLDGFWRSLSAPLGIAVTNPRVNNSGIWQEASIALKILQSSCWTRGPEKHRCSDSMPGALSLLLPWLCPVVWTRCYHHGRFQEEHESYPLLYHYYDYQTACCARGCQEIRSSLPSHPGGYHQSMRCP